MLRRMSRLLAALALIAAPAALAQSNAENLLAACGDTSLSAEGAARYCANALRAGGLTPSQAAAAGVNLGGALLELGRPAEAETAYEAALARRPDQPLALAGRARAREALGRPAEAAEDWARAVAAAPGDMAVRGSRGAFRLRSGDAEGALEDFDAGLARDPKNLDLRFNRGLALMELGRDAEAETAFSAVIAARPDDADAWLERARARLSRDKAAALADYDEAVKRAGTRPQAVFERGALLEQMGRKAEGERDLRRAFELGHPSEWLAERIRAMGG
jgi:tetratricopeptide (TPR) repeat protein